MGNFLVSDLGFNCSGFSLGQLFGQRKRRVFCKIVPDPDLVFFFSNMKARRYKEFFLVYFIPLTHVASGNYTDL